MKFTLEEFIIWEDENWLALNKPPLVATLADRVSPFNMLDAVRKFYPSAQACHRLDKETTGVLVLAKNAEAYRHLSLQFQQRQVNKIYHAVVQGVHYFTNQLIEAALDIPKVPPVKVSSRGKKSATRVNSLAQYRKHTLVECQPLTGRLHQIRAHLSHAGAPIVGDTLYGGKPLYLSELKADYRLKKGTAEAPLMGRTALHALRLAFSDLSGKKVELEAPYPKDFRGLLRQLERQ